MEVIGFIVIIIVLFVVIAMKNDVSSKLRDIDRKLTDISKQINRLSSEEPATATKAKAIEEAFRQEAHKLKTILPEERKPEPRKEEVKKEEIKKEEIRKEEEIKTPEIKNETYVVAASVKPVANMPPPKKIIKPGFFERNPDLEKFIGENLANKIGIAILVIGIGFFVKYAIDKEWINEIGRVFIGILCGGILLGIAHRLRKTFAAFSSVLVGGGIAVLYFTIAIAFHEYHIFNQTAAFILMVIITGFAVVLSIGYNRVELAVLAILGGFGSPFMVSTGEGNYIVLFTYMLILNTGMLVLAYHKKWRIINIICYAFTILIFGSWLATRFDEKKVSMISGSLLFATLFYFVFFMMNIINNIRQRTKFEALEIMMLLSNTFLYYSAGMFILNNNIGEDLKGLFTALLGVFNFGFAYALYKNARVDKNLVFMLIGLVLTFISLAAPIQLKGNYITLFWAAEAVVLLWLAQKSGIRLITLASVIVTVLMVISLLLDWKQIYFDSNDHLTVLLNKGYITSLVSVVSLLLTARLLRNETDSVIKVSEYKAGITIGVCILVYVMNLIELRHQLIYYVDSYAARSVIIGTYNTFCVLILLLSERRLNIADEIKQTLPAFGIISIGAYLFFYHGMTVEARNEYLDGYASSLGFFFHYIMLAKLIVNAVLTIRKLNTLAGIVESIHHAHWWLFVFFFVFVASAELDHIVVLAAYSGPGSIGYLVEENHRFGFPILWGISSFILIAYGLKKKVKMIRIISLVLMLITLLKLFIIDLRDISEAGKIVAFISLGVLLLIVSFMYQRLKKLLLEDVPQGKQDNT